LGLAFKNKRIFRRMTERLEKEFIKWNKSIKMLSQGNCSERGQSFQLLQRKFDVNRLVMKLLVRLLTFLLLAVNLQALQLFSNFNTEKSNTYGYRKEIYQPVYSHTDTSKVDIIKWTMEESITEEVLQYCPSERHGNGLDEQIWKLQGNRDLLLRSCGNALFRSDNQVWKRLVAGRALTSLSARESIIYAPDHSHAWTVQK